MREEGRHQADQVLRAYRYQLLHALQAWLELREDQELLLEIDEDHAVSSDLRSEGSQVKFSATARGPKALTLRSAGLMEAIERYWAQSRGGEDGRIYLRLLTNSSAAREQGARLPEGSAGLVYWRRVARTGDTGPLRELLVDIFGDRALGAWLKTAPTDEAIRSRLLQRVEFVLNAPDDAALALHIRDRLGMLYLSKGRYETLGELALPVLLSRVFAAASAPEIEERRLRVVDLHRALEEVLPREGAYATAQPPKASPETGYAIAPLRLRPGMANRTATVTACAERIRDRTLVWLYGANGVGKSTLAALIARAAGGNWIAADFRPFQDGRGAIGVWHELTAALTTGSIPDGVVLDDISNRAIELLKARIRGLVASFEARGAKIIITSNHSPSPALLGELGAAPEAALESGLSIGAEN